MRKLDWDKKYFRWGVTVCLALCGAVLFHFLVVEAGTIFTGAGFLVSITKPIIYGLVFGYLLSPVFNFFDTRVQRYLAAKGWTGRKARSISKNICILITVILAVIVIALLFGMVVPEMLRSIYSIIESMPDGIRRLGVELNIWLKENPGLETPVMAVYNNVTSRFETWMQGNLLQEVTAVVTGLSIGVIGVFRGVLDLIVGVIVCVYVLSSKDVFCSQGKKLCYGMFKVGTANRIIEEFRFAHKVFGGFIGGKLLDSLIIGILAFLCLSVMGMPYVLLVSVIIGVTNIIPFFGPFIGAIPSAFLILMVDPMQCVYFVIFILILQQIDGNIIGPKILGDSTGLSSFWVIFAILVGGGSFGFAGMVLGVPCFAMLYHFVKNWVENSLQRKGMPQKTEEYVHLSFFEQQERGQSGMDIPGVDISREHERK